jgi:hypothetical protein
MRLSRPQMKIWDDLIFYAILERASGDYYDRRELTLSVTSWAILTETRRRISE